MAETTLTDDRLTTAEAPEHEVLLTETAAAKVASLLAQEGRDDLRLRVAVQPGGCSGLVYQLYFDERLLDGDAVRAFPTGGGEMDSVEVVVDRMSVPYLSGATIDFADTHREAGLHHRQPQRRRNLRLRRVFQLIPANEGPPSRKDCCWRRGVPDPDRHSPRLPAWRSPATRQPSAPKEISCASTSLALTSLILAVALVVLVGCSGTDARTFPTSPVTPEPSRRSPGAGRRLPQISL